MNGRNTALVVIAVVIIAAIVVAAWAWSGMQPPVEEEEEEEVVDEGPFAREQAYVWGANFYGPLPNMNPVTELRITAGYDRPCYVYEPLAVLTPDGRWIPMLAEEWNWVEDYILEIKIFEEAHWWDGQPVTADDVRFSLETLADSTISGILDAIGYSDMVDRVEVVDEKTLRLHTYEEIGPRHPRVYLTLLPPTRIFPEEQWSQLLEEWGEDIGDYANLDPEQIIASGPYNLFSNTAESTIFKRVDNYWGNQIGRYYAPRFYQALWLGTAELVTRALEEGDLDVGEVVGIDITWIQERKEPAGWLWIHNPDAPTLGEGMAFEMCDFVCTFNMEREILRHQWLREAMAYAINYEMVIRVEATAELGAQSGPYYLPFRLPEEYYNTDIADEYYETKTVLGVSVIKHDPQKAVEILSEHCEGSVEEGWTYEGEKIGPFELIIWPYGPVVAASEVIATSLRDVGIEATANPVEWGLYLARTEGGAYDFDIRWALHGLSPFPDPITAAYTETFLTPSTCWGGSKVEYWWYWDGNHPPLENTAGQVRELVDQLWYLEVGSDEFIAVNRQIQEIVIPQLPMIPLYQKIAPAIYSTTHWVNMPYGDDPLDWLPKASNEYHGTVMNVHPRAIETVGAELSESTVSAGGTVTVEVTLRNTGLVPYYYPVMVHEGPAAPGASIEHYFNPEKLLAHKAVVVEAGTSRTIELEVTIDTAGVYTLTVDCWRYSNYDPGNPIELTLTVE